MAETRAVWGIDIGQAGLKAIKLRYNENADKVMALAFDYIPHAKILSQPDAVPDELIAQAIEKFLSRNDVRGDVVAISVPGQTALARFIQLPPVEAGKVPEIVRYEAKQQIPFDLDEVIWDYQPLSSGTEESGYLLDAEVGLFAMKRDQVMQHLRPFTNAKVEVDLIQIAPLAMYNLLSFDHLGLKMTDEVLAEDEFTMLVDMGCDTSTILISNGKKIWIRNIPIGGNHFTRALTKEMKLTFAKAEHLKCNATKSPDPRAVFQALRPVFNDYVAEIQRSIGFFSSVNRDSKIVKILGLGNGFKLAGLQKFLQQNLQYEVERVESFQAAIGDAVLNAPLMQENLMSFGVSYGLALQALKLTRIHTSLLPPELITARKIRRKKPWAVVTAATLLIGLSLSVMGYSNVARTVGTDRWSTAETNLKTVQGELGSHKSAYDAEAGTYKTLYESGNKLINADTREYWLELYRAINACLPRDPADLPEDTPLSERKRIKLFSITAEKKTDLKEWFDALPQGTKDRMPEADKTTAPTGEGYVFTLEGVHYRHDDKDTTETGTLYVAKTLLKNLQSWTVEQPVVGTVPVKKLGISHAVLVRMPTSKRGRYYPNGQNSNLAGLRGGAGAGDAGRIAGRGAMAAGRGTMPARGADIRGAGVMPRRPGMGVGNRPAGRPAGPAGAGKGGERLPGALAGAGNPGIDPLMNLDPDEGQETVVEGTQTEFTLEFVWKPTLHSDRPEQPPVDPAALQGGTTPAAGAGDAANSPTNAAPPPGAATPAAQGPGGAAGAAAPAAGPPGVPPAAAK
ncbi:MAG: type IV pilus assembly protein PilM [Planctomycetaceae bacterium]